jgi:hypothetical protein
MIAIVSVAFCARPAGFLALNRVANVQMTVDNFFMTSNVEVRSRRSAKRVGMQKIQFFGCPSRLPGWAVLSSLKPPIGGQLCGVAPDEARSSGKRDCDQ